MKRFQLSSLAVAVGATLALGTGAALAALPPLKTQGEVQYVTGGVGKIEAQSFQEAQSKFPVALEFVRKASPRDEFVANVEVRMLDAAGKNVLATRTDGPFLLARLPAGEYTVKATYDGRTLEKTLQVTDHASARAVFVWDMKR